MGKHTYNIIDMSLVSNMTRQRIMSCVGNTLATFDTRLPVHDLLMIWAYLKH